MIRQLRNGLEGVFAAPRFMFRNGMAWLFVVPVVLWLLFAYFVFAGVGALVDDLGARIAAYFEISSAVPLEAMSWWDHVVGWFNASREMIVVIVLKIALFFLFALVNKYIMLILLSPLLAYASERAEKILTGVDIPFDLRRFLWEIWRGVLIALRNGAIELSITVVAWTMTLFVPIIAPITAVMLFLLSAYFYGFSMFDYICERRRSSIRDSVRFVNARMPMVIANGAIFSILMKVPFLGMVVAPLLCAVGAVLAEVERPRHSALKTARIHTFSPPQRSA